MKEFADYKRVLVVGAGSGRDMAATTLITSRLKQKGVVVDVAGFLTPWAVHYFDGVLEKPVNALNAKSKKFLCSDLRKPLTGYFEPLLPELNRRFKLGIRRFYVFSLHYGSRKLKQEIKAFITKGKYDLIVVVDVGGDCLAQKAVLKSIFTPIVDFSCMHLISQVVTTEKVVLAVVAPTTDGEITTSRMTKILSDVRKEGMVLFDEKISADPEAYQSFIGLNQAINQETTSTSGTVRIITKAMDGTLHTEEGFEKSVMVGDKRFVYAFRRKLSADLVNQIIYLDFQKFVATMPIKQEYDSIFDAQLRYRSRTNGTEIDLSYIPIIRNSVITKTIFSLTPANMINGRLRKSIIQEGLKLLDDKTADSILMLKTDRRYIKKSLHAAIREYKDFVILDSR